jgi:hypothetical protein
VQRHLRDWRCELARAWSQQITRVGRPPRTHLRMPCLASSSTTSSPARSRSLARRDATIVVTLAFVHDPTARTVAVAHPSVRVEVSGEHEGKPEYKQSDGGVYTIGWDCGNGGSWRIAEEGDYIYCSASPNPPLLAACGTSLACVWFVRELAFALAVSQSTEPCSPMRQKKGLKKRLPLPGRAEIFLGPPRAATVQTGLPCGEGNPLRWEWEWERAAMLKT